MKIIIACLLLLMLVSCTEERDYNYYLVHPKKAFAMMEQCGVQSNKECQAARNARDYLMPLLEMEEKQPQAFGWEIMQAEQTLSKLKEKIYQQKKQLKNLDKSNETTLSRKQAQTALDKTKYKLHQAEVRVKALLAIVSLVQSP